MWELVWSILQQVCLGLGRGEAVSERRVQTFLGFLEAKQGVSGASGLRESSDCRLLAQPIPVSYRAREHRLWCARARAEVTCMRIRAIGKE